jgi:hypothetical protein
MRHKNGHLLWPLAYSLAGQDSFFHSATALASTARLKKIPSVGSGNSARMTSWLPSLFSWVVGAGSRAAFRWPGLAMGDCRLQKKSEVEL